MKELLYTLIGIKQYIKQYHWLAAGYENHILADKLEDDLDDQIDELAELLLASGEEDNTFYAKNLLKDAIIAIDDIYTGYGMEEMLKALVGLFGRVLSLAKQPIEDEMLETAFADFRGRLSNSVLRKLYLIQIQLKK